MEPVVGFEPTTDGLQNRCSTTELNWLETPPGRTRAANAMTKGMYSVQCSRSSECKNNAAPPDVGAVS
jgi:hypothetical protein